MNDMRAMDVARSAACQSRRALLGGGSLERREHRDHRLGAPAQIRARSLVRGERRERGPSHGQLVSVVLAGVQIGAAQGASQVEERLHGRRREIGIAGSGEGGELGQGELRRVQEPRGAKRQHPNGERSIGREAGDHGCIPEALHQRREGEGIAVVHLQEGIDGLSPRIEGHDEAQPEESRQCEQAAEREHGQR